MTQMQWFGAAAAMNTVNNNPLMGWMFGKRDPLQHGSSARQALDKMNQAKGLKAGTRAEQIARERTGVLRSVLDRNELEQHRFAVGHEAGKAGGLDTRFGLSQGIWGGVMDGASIEKAAAHALDLGASPEAVRRFLKTEDGIDNVRDPMVPAISGRVAGAFQIALDSQRESDNHILHGAELAAIRTHVDRYSRSAPALGKVNKDLDAAGNMIDPYGIKDLAKREAPLLGMSEADYIRGIETEADRIRGLARGGNFGLRPGQNHLTKEDFDPYYASTENASGFSFDPAHGVRGDQRFQGNTYAHMLVENRQVFDMEQRLEKFVEAHAIDPTTSIPADLLSVVNESMGVRIRRGGTVGPGNVVG